MRVAFVDMAFHQKTLSNTFLSSLLRHAGHTVDFFWDNSLDGGKRVHINKVMGYDASIFFQVPCVATRAYCHYSNNITFIPMLDSYINDTASTNSNIEKAGAWERFGLTKICNFSSYLHIIHSNIGLYSKYFKFYPKPSTQQTNKGLHGFFWVRRSDRINLNTIYTLIKDTHFDTFHIHMPHDPSTPPPVIPSYFGKNIDYLTTSTWFNSKNVFLARLQNANIFFAPRPVEGIGQSFLEAMSYGQCVVAPNFGTMNEYITHGVTGLLYDKNNITSLDFSNITTICSHAYASVQEGYTTWLKNEKALVEYMLTPASAYYCTLPPHAILKPRMSAIKALLETKILQWLKPYIKSIYNCIKKT